MPISVNIEGVGIREFPDEMPLSEIEKQAKALQEPLLRARQAKKDLGQAELYGDTSLGERLAKAFPDTPLIPAKTIQNVINPKPVEDLMPWTGPVAKAVAGMTASLISPRNALIAAGIGAAPKPISSAIEGAFATQMAGGTMASGKQAFEELKQGKIADAAQHGVEALLQGGMGFLGGRASLEGGGVLTPSGDKVIPNKPADPALNAQVVDELKAQGAKTPQDVADIEAAKAGAVPPKVEGKSLADVELEKGPGQTVEPTPDTGEPPPFKQGDVPVSQTEDGKVSLSPDANTTTVVHEVKHDIADQGLGEHPPEDNNAVADDFLKKSVSDIINPPPEPPGGGGGEPPKPPTYQQKWDAFKAAAKSIWEQKGDIWLEARSALGRRGTKYVESLSEETAQRLRSAANSKAQSTAMNIRFQNMADAAGSPEKYEAAKKVLQQDQLDDIRAKYIHAAESLEEDPFAFTDPRLAGLAKKVGIDHTPLAPAQFRELAEKVKDVMTPEEYAAANADPGVRKGIENYQQNILPRLVKLQEQAHGEIRTIETGNKTYFPLVEARIPEEAPGPVFGTPAGRSPLTVLFREGTGTYSTADDALQGHMTGLFKRSDAIGLLDSVEKEGLGKRVEPGGEPLTSFTINGKKVPVAGLKMPDGSTMYMPKQLLAELNTTLLSKMDENPMGPLNHVAQALTDVQLNSGPADFSIHTSNLLGTAAVVAPYIPRESGVATALSNAPVAKLGSIIEKVFLDLKKNPPDVDKLERMAANGELTPRWGSGDKPATGLGHQLNIGHKLLYGTWGIEMRDRVMMHDILTEVHKAKGLPEPTPLQYYDFVSHLGEYNHALKSELARTASRLGLSPFFTAGYTMTRNGIKAITGRNFQAQVTGGAIGYTAAWTLLYQAATGKWWWNDPRMKVFQIPIGQPDEKGKQSYIGLPGLPQRGARALGIRGLLETFARGGNLRQALAAAQADIINSVAHPLIGPAASAGFEGITGSKGYLVPEGGSLRPLVTREQRDKWVQAAVLNALFDLIQPIQGYSDVAGKGWGSLLNKAMPGVYSRENVEGRQKRLEQEQRRWDRDAARQPESQ